MVRDGGSSGGGVGGGGDHDEDDWLLTVPKTSAGCASDRLASLL